MPEGKGARDRLPDYGSETDEQWSRTIAEEERHTDARAAIQHNPETAGRDGQQDAGHGDGLAVARRQHDRKEDPEQELYGE
jgi:hypothetical protein